MQNQFKNLDAFLYVEIFIWNETLGKVQEKENHRKKVINKNDK